jgi:hypothetical protein
MNIPTNNVLESMNKLGRQDLMSLEKYAEARPEFRRQVMAHKKNRQVALGPNARLYFEDRLTMQYQVQEMLRIEKIFEAEGIDEELEAYNPLIPDGTNWKATFMVEYADPEERRQQLARLIGIERSVWVCIGDHEKVHPIANEDLQRETEDKTSSVHFLRFELSAPMVESIKRGAGVTMGVSHPEYSFETGPLPSNIVQSLADDLALRN